MIKQCILEDKMAGHGSWRKRISLLVIVTTMGLQLTGCSLIPEVDVTEEQSGLIAEYAAGLLLKYESGHEIGLEKLTEEPITDENAETAIEGTPIEESAPGVEQADNQDALNAATEVLQNDNTAPITSSAVPLASALGLDGFEISYQSYEICDFYPKEESDAMIFSMQAAPNKDLLIVHFNLTNVTESDQMCDMVDSDVMFRLIINDSERINEQTTILLNDLKVYQDMVTGYGTVDTVLVFEIEKGSQDSFETLQLLVKNGDQENTYALQ